MYQGESDSVTLPSDEGEICILPNHIPLITSLKKGTIRSKFNGENREFKIERGFAQIERDKITLLIDKY